MKDITNELKERLEKLQADADNIAQKRQDLDAAERDVQARIQALRTTIDLEHSLHGRANGKSQWLGVGVVEAVDRILTEHPKWVHAQIRDYLISEGFDFSGKNPGLSVNQALIRRRRGNK